MKKINIGVANLIVSEVLKGAYFRKELVTETQFDKKNVSEIISNFAKTIQDSPLLQQEMKIFENLEKKYSNNDFLATRYIDNNVNLLETYTFEELQEAHKKLEPFMVDIEIDSEKRKLYESISSLIEESLKPCDEVDVDLVHESFEVVLNHIKNNKPEEKPELPANINEEVIEIAINKFNQKYENLTSEEVALFKKLFTSTDNEKKGLFEEYKNENISILEKLQEENQNEKISKSLEKINEMKFDSKTADTNIIKLFELKKGLI